eukprot:5559228-Pyramimonas_sp.AAC.2
MAFLRSARDPAGPRANVSNADLASAIESEDAFSPSSHDFANITEKGEGSTEVPVGAGNVGKDRVPPHYLEPLGFRHRTGQGERPAAT